jgi:hypothetical protein
MEEASMTIDELSARLERVERQNRRLRAGGVAAVVLLAAGVAMGQAAPVPKVVRAERWEVVDGGGTVRAKCFVSPEGAVGLALCDRDGKVRALYGVNKDDFPHFAFMDAGGSPRAALHTASDGSMGLGFTTDGGKGGLLLSNETDGARGLVFMGSGGKPQLHVHVTADGSPEIGMWNKDGDAILKVPAK